jgi:FixJ family two-component response regulator
MLMVKADHWIAIVDDDPSVLKALKRSLRVRALQSKTFGSAQEFLAALPDGLPKCLIVDLQMPGMSGLELLVHMTRRDINVPTIIMTAHDDMGVRQRCKAAGAIAFFAKPLANASLFMAVDAAIGDH